MQNKMTTEILNELIELKKVSDWITTNQLIRELKKFGNGNDIVTELIDKKVVDRILDEKIDICSFDTTKLKRLIKLKKLSD